MRSAGGTPSISAMTVSGRGQREVGHQVHDRLAGGGVEQLLGDLLDPRSLRFSTLAGVKAFWTRLRSRRCSGGSFSTMLAPSSLSRDGIHHWSGGPATAAALAVTGEAGVPDHAGDLLMARQHEALTQEVLGPQHRTKLPQPRVDGDRVGPRASRAPELASKIDTHQVHQCCNRLWRGPRKGGPAKGSSLNLPARSTATSREASAAGLSSTGAQLIHTQPQVLTCYVQSASSCSPIASREGG